MQDTEKPDIDRFFADSDGITRALTKAVRQALLQHKRAGNPVATWKDGKVVWIPADEIILTEEDN